MPSTITDRLDGISTSTAVKPPCNAVTSANITLSGLQTIGGVVLAEGDRVLVRAQTSFVDNGIYDASTSDWTRAKDFDGNRDARQGTLVLVRTGTADGAIYEVTTANPITIGTSAITFDLRDDPAITYAQTQAEIDAEVVPVNYAYPPGDERRYGVTADGTTDDTAALEATYAACAAGSYQLCLTQKGTRKITSQLLWDGKVDVIGLSREDTIISAAGNFYAIRIDQNGQESLYENFTVTRSSGTGGGIDIYLGNRISMRRIKSIDHVTSGHGILLRAGNLGTYEDIVVRGNADDGINIASGTGEDPGNSAWACRWTNIDAINNGGWGFNVDIGNSHFGLGIVAQNNTGGGVRVNANTNVLQIYSENNTGLDLDLTSSSVRNFITTNNIDSVADLSDQGTNNSVLDVAVFPLLQMPNVMPLPRVTNAAGRQQTVSGGNAGAGATGMVGGKLRLSGGDAVGTTGAANGGDVELEGGATVNSGAKGQVVVKACGLVQARAGVTYSASMTPNAALATLHSIGANDANAFTINAPSNPREAQFITFTIRNISGGALGVATWDAVFKMAAWTQPANGTSRSIEFFYDGTNWIECSRTPADVPN